MNFDWDLLKEFIRESDSYRWMPPEPDYKPKASNTFKRNPEPRAGYIDARESLTVPVITTAEWPVKPQPEPEAVRTWVGLYSGVVARNDDRILVKVVS